MAGVGPSELKHDLGFLVLEGALASIGQVPKQCAPGPEHFRARNVCIEKEVFFGFYAIRKLIEGYKLTDATRDMLFDLSWYPARRTVDFMNWHRIEKNYDLGVTRTEKRDLVYLCNQFIHSYLFLVSEDEGRLGGIYVASDRERQRRCFFITRAQAVQAFRAVGHDDQCGMTLVRDPGTGQFSIRSVGPTSRSARSRAKTRAPG